MSKINRRHAIGKENVKNGEEVPHVKAAPDFSKLHKQWDKKLQKGKAVKKKPLTSIQPFQLSQIPGRTNIQNETKFKIDTNSKENFKDDNGGRFSSSAISRSTAQQFKSSIPRFSKPPPPPQPSAKLQPPSSKHSTVVTGTLKHTVVVTDTDKPVVIRNILKPVVVQQPSSKPVVVQQPSSKPVVVLKPVVISDVTKPAMKRSHLPQLSTHAKKVQPQPLQEFKVDFKCDKAALDSILNGEGIQLPSASPSRLSSKCGPARRDHSRKRVVPFQKPSANSRLSDRSRLSISRVVPGNLESANASNAAKKRWSIYNRDSFCTKTDLMTWLKDMAGLPSSSSNQSGENNSTVVTVSKTLVVSSASCAVNNVSDVCLSTSSSSSSVCLSTSSANYHSSNSSNSMSAADVNFLRSTSIQGTVSTLQSRASLSRTQEHGSSVNAFLGDKSASNTVLGDKSAFKFNHSVVGFQVFDDGMDEDHENVSKDLRCPTFLTPEKAKPHNAKPITTTKSILKKTTLSCIEEANTLKVSDKNVGINDKNAGINDAKEKRKMERRTPTRGKKSTLRLINEIDGKNISDENNHLKEQKMKEIRTPTRGIKKSLVRIEEVVDTENVTINELSEKMKEIRTPSRVVKSSLCCIEEVVDGEKKTDKNAPKEIKTPLRGNKRTPKKERTPLRSAQKKGNEKTQPLRAVTQTYTPARSSTPRKKTTEVDDSCAKESPEYRIEKRVHWNTDLTYLSPVDVTPVDDLHDESMSSLMHRQCAVQLFCDDTLANNTTLESMGAGTCEDLLDLTTNNVSVNLMSNNAPSSYYGNNVPCSYYASDTQRKLVKHESIVSKSQCLLNKPSSPLAFNNILIDTSVTSCSVLPTKSVTSHQIKYIIPAEQPLEKSESQQQQQQQSANKDKEFVKSSSYSLGGETNGCRSVQSWADILGNMSAAPVSQTTPSQKGRKKKRFSILDRIYGDANKSPVSSLDDKSAFKEPENNFDKNEFPNTKPSADHMAFSVNQSLSSISTLHVLGNEYNQGSFFASPAILRRPASLSHSPSTVVTYSKNANNILYGDLREASGVKPENIIQASPFPLITFSSERKNKKSNKELFVSNLTKSKSVIDTNAQVSQEDLSFLLTRSNVMHGMTPVCLQPFTVPVYPKEPVNVPVYPKEPVNVPVYPNDGTITNESNAPHTRMRSAKLDKYVTSLLDSPAVCYGVTPMRPVTVDEMSRKDVTVDEMCTVQTKQEMTSREAVHNTSQSISRSVQLDKYVTSLLDSPTNAGIEKSTSAHALLQKQRLEQSGAISTDISSNIARKSTKSDDVLQKPRREQSGAISTDISSNIASTDFLCESDNDSNDTSLDSDNDVCMVFSTPFRQGLHNHILQSSSFIGVPKEIRQSPSTPTNQHLSELQYGKTSAFRRIPAKCNILPKNISPITLTKKSDEMQDLIGAMSSVFSPDKQNKLLDAEVSLYHQLGEISSRFHGDCNVIRNGSRNPLSIILTVGDETHFVPINAEPILIVTS